MDSPALGVCTGGGWWGGSWWPWYGGWCWVAEFGAASAPGERQAAAGHPAGGRGLLLYWDGRSVAFTLLLQGSTWYALCRRPPERMFRYNPQAWFLNARQLAEVLGVHERTPYRSGLPYYALTPGTIRWLRADVFVDEEPFWEMPPAPDIPTAAKLLNISRSSAYRLSRKWDCFPRPSSRHRPMHVNVSELVEFARSKRVEGEPSTLDRTRVEVF